MNDSPPSAQSPEPCAPAPESSPSSSALPSPPGRIARLIAWSRAKSQRLSTWAIAARGRYRTVDVGFLAADRDKRVVAGVLAGGVAYRFFFWLLAISLLTNGALGFFEGQDVQAALVGQGVDPSVAASIQDMQPSDAARWWLLIVGVWLVLWSGYLGAKALILVHATVWGYPRHAFGECSLRHWRSPVPSSA